MDKSKNNYKYIIAVSSFILMAVAFSIVNSVNTILTAPVINARNFSIGEFSLLFTITAITVAICSPLVGSLLNKVNIKIIMSLSSILAGGGYMLYGLANNILSFYLIGVIVAIGMCGLTTIPISTMISDWFEPEKKGSIMGIVFAGIGTGTFFWMQIVSRFLERYNYRLAYFFLGAIVVIVSLPISLFIAKRPDDVMNKLKDSNNKSDKSKDKSYTFKDISKAPSFWTFSIGLLLMGISFAGIKQHIQPYLSVLGYSMIKSFLRASSSAAWPARLPRALSASRESRWESVASSSARSRFTRMSSFVRSSAPDASAAASMAAAIRPSRSANSRRSILAPDSASATSVRNCSSRAA